MRKVADCREFPSENNCSLTISGTEQEVLEAATQHAVSAHGRRGRPCVSALAGLNGPGVALAAE